MIKQLFQGKREKEEGKMWASAGLYLCLFTFALFLVAPAVRGAEQTLSNADEKTNIATLRSNAGMFEKVAACRELARIGTKESVPVLAALLTDQNLSHMARNALEGIPDPAAADALREALGKVKGDMLAGVIGSCARKHDERAVDAIAGFLNDADPHVAYAAGYALGRIANEAAVAALEKDLANTPIKPMTAEGYLMCAEAVAKAGKAQQAIAMYDKLRNADVPGRLKIAATRGAIVARGAAGIPMVVEAIKSDSALMLSAALRSTVEMPGAEITKAIAGTVESISPDKQIVVLQALGNRGDSAAAPAVIAVVKSGSAKVKPVAVAVLGQIADASNVPLLFDLAAGDDGELARPAQAALAAIPGKGVDAALDAKLDSQDAKIRRVAMSILGQRRVPGFAARLIKLSTDSDNEMRTSAIKTLGEVVTVDQLDVLINVLVNPKAPADIQSAESALAAACVRLADADPCATKLVAAMAQAQPAAKSAILRVLRSVGGEKALAAVRSATGDQNAEVVDAATRALCDWTTSDAAPDLLNIAKNSANATHKALAFRGYVRMIGQRDIQPAAKLAMCKEALALAQSDQQKRQLLGALSAIQNRQSLDMVVQFLDGESVRGEACTAAVQIAERMVARNPKAVVDAMNKVIAATKDEDIIGRAKAVLEKANAGR